jgi:transcriptional regulator with XRE-family HTH domain
VENMDKLSEMVGARLKNLREEKGFSQEQLASKANVSRTFIANLELCKKNVTVNTLLKITDALEISLSDFFQFLQPNLVHDVEDISLLNSIINKILSMDYEQQQDISALISIFLKWNAKTKD